MCETARPLFSARVLVRRVCFICTSGSVFLASVYVSVRLSAVTPVKRPHDFSRVSCVVIVVVWSGLPEKEGY